MLAIYFVGLAATVLTSFASVPQIWTIVTTRSARDISMTTVSLIVAGNVMWFVYGVFLSDFVLAGAAVVSMAFNLWIVALKTYYDSRPSGYRPVGAVDAGEDV